ncbi:MAG: META domain-containing protein [Odoribacteraceae bacterium]|nr:META domain-containing protein [Odoribacteraceae bacterium]
MTCALAGALSSCKPTVDHSAALKAHEWQLKEMMTADGNVLLPSRVPTIVFTDSSRVGGFSGCNRFMGKYELKGEKLMLSKLATTHMMCMENMDFERKFQKALSEVKRLALQPGELKLLDESGTQTLVFIPGKGTATTDEGENRPEAK